MSISTSLHAVGENQLALADLEDLSLFFEEDDLITIVTKHPQSLRDAPAIASVITAREIRKMGARSIQDVLHRLPGFDISMTATGSYIIEVRGILASQKIKVMVDGHTVQEEVNQGVGWAWDTITLENVKRIEVIRGPASSLYGTNAYAGIINIVTNDGEDVDGVIGGVGIGSFNTKRSNLQLGGRSGDLEYAFYANGYKTDGDSLFLERDTLGNSGKTVFWEEQVDFAAKFNYQGWQLNSRYLEKRRGPYIGIGHALNDESEIKHGQYFVDLSYQGEINEQLDISTKLFLDRSTNFDQYWQLWPASAYPAPPGGLVAHAITESETYGAELQFDYQLFENNLLTFGAAVEHHELFNAQFFVNFNLDYSPIGYLKEVTGDRDWIDQPKAHRDIWALYMQDIWTLSEQVTLTFGVRHDEYSDFGSSTSPKVAAVWKMDDHWDLKVQYAKGFKAPTFAELYVQDNPAQTGNPNLKPETADTYELSLGYITPGQVNTRLTYFNINEQDKIVMTQTGTGQSENIGGTEIEGIEFEWKKELGAANNIYFNYTWQDARYSLDDSKIEDIASHKGNIGGDYLINRYLNLNTNIYVTGDRPRAAGDSRDDHKGYALTDMTFTFSRYITGLEVRASIYNLFNKKYTYPSVYNPAGDVTDYPQERRHYSLDIRYSF
ncbi:MAG: TonB-dependent receptor [Candidatus Polarisedimenticolaceae bacterium]|nr:TonB-dependent receptor [Candidatus Polarisedimenticolaceae bacterium]